MPASSRRITAYQLRKVFRLCDPEGTGFVSVQHLTDLALQYAQSKNDAEEVAHLLDPKGRGFLSYRDFCLGVNTLMERAAAGSADRDTMMAPSVGEGGQRSLPNFCDDSSAESNGKENSRCSSLSDGESFECFGEADMDTGTPQSLSGDGLLRSPRSEGLKRNTWLRTSLRRTPSNNHENLPNRRWGSFRQPSGKRLGSNALASQLYRSSSFNSSGRSSTCDTGDDIYSDVSLEEDVLDLNHKVQMLQQQMSVLADNQSHTDERYTRAKQDNATLQARVLMLEEQLREVELRSEERLAEEERRHRELVARVDREKQLQVENCAIRLQTLELENSSLKEEATRCRSQTEKLRTEKAEVEERLGESQSVVCCLQEEVHSLKDQERRQKECVQANQQLVEELTQEVERLRREVTTLQELNQHSREPQTQLQEQLDSLRQEHRSLQEAHEELQVVLLSRGVEEGRNLLSAASQGHSLAAELDDMTQDDPLSDKDEDKKMRSAYKESQEVITHLRRYIDDILLLIVENCPRLLEKKGGPPAP
ncbi:rab11 family-interacting protein 4A [Macrosteles quadrilineatus]|uniref:rab11 family-interacting protein 4A n=1 Tax=Macrosteles quadrilineatus TaxID=74068 RepID=UPI0023E343A5|nr:rab11 family-interacting protein 4A [Macrosteles quadrilineatus]